MWSYFFVVAQFYIFEAELISPARDQSSMFELGNQETEIKILTPKQAPVEREKQRDYEHIGRDRFSDLFMYLYGDE